MITGNTATFSGSGTNQRTGATVSFTVTVQDNGEPGSSDTFQITGSGFAGASGTLHSGNIQIHKP